MQKELKINALHKFIFAALVGLALAARPPPSSAYGAPNGGFGGDDSSSGYDNSNGASSHNSLNGGNGNGNGYGASNGGFGNGGSSGYGASNSGFGNGGSSGHGSSNGGSSGYGASNNGFGSGGSSGHGSSNGGFNNGGSSGYGSSNGGNRRGASSGYGAPKGYGVDPAIEALAENIPGGGVPGEDYPILSEVPQTAFACENQQFPGYYADTDGQAGCQVFHICQDRGNRIQQNSFLCPNGTIFNQQYLVCDWWFNFDCADAESFYSVNELIGQEPDPYGKPKNNGYGNNGGQNNGHKSSGNQNGGYGASYWLTNFRFFVTLMKQSMYILHGI